LLNQKSELLLHASFRVKSYAAEEAGDNIHKDIAFGTGLSFDHDLVAMRCSHKLSNMT
jgi:hypothetical protein